MEPVDSSASSLPDNVKMLLGKHPGRTWVVTGAAGFIGSHLVETLVAAGERVRAVDNFLTGHRKNIEAIQHRFPPGSFEFHELDIRNSAAMAEVCSGADFVLHQAALGSVPRSVDDPLSSNEMNVSGFLTVLSAAARSGVRRIVYASSSAVYGDCTDEVKSESRIGASLSPYAASKRCDEVYADAFSRVYSQSIVGLRYFNVFGPRQDPEGPYAAVIPRWLQALATGLPCKIYGDGKTSRDFCYVRNVVQANLLAAMSETSLEHEVFNIAVGTTTSLARLFELLSTAVSKEMGQGAGQPVQPEYHPFRKGDIRMSLADISKAERQLGYRPTHTLDSGIIETVRWFVQQQSSLTALS